jgi:hypothetical protein
MIRALDRALADPAASQERRLRGLLHEARDTEWGRRFGFAEIARAADAPAAFRDRVPLHDYEAYRDDVRRVREGAHDVFWPGPIRHFAVSSGTASAGKIIPLSPEMLGRTRDYTLGMALRYAMATGTYGWMGGRLLTVPGRVEPDVGGPGTWVGEVSGLMYLAAPWPVRRFKQAVPRDVLFTDGWGRKLRMIADRTCRMDIRAMAMVPSWAVVLFPMLVERYNELTGGRATCVRDVWPNLQVFFSGAVALSSYEDLMRRQIGGSAPMHFVEGYGASEGPFAFQGHPDERDMLLHLANGVYYEFVRMDDASDAPRRHTLADVEPDVRYRICVSTCSGLWAYGVGDVIRFTGTRPHRIVVAGRTNEMLDRYGEAVFGEEARAAIESACADAGAHLRDYHVTSVPPVEGRMPRHRWLVEFAGPAPDTERIATAIDAYLQRVNRHYVIRRECGAFERPEIVALPEGTFLRWLRATRDHVDAQTKVPRMSEDPRTADEVLEFAETITEPSS